MRPFRQSIRILPAVGDIPLERHAFEEGGLPAAACRGAKKLLAGRVRVQLEGAAEPPLPATSNGTCAVKPPIGGRPVLRRIAGTDFTTITIDHSEGGSR